MRNGKQFPATSRTQGAKGREKRAPTPEVRACTEVIDKKKGGDAVSGKKPEKGDRGPRAVKAVQSEKRKRKGLQGLTLATCGKKGRRKQSVTASARWPGQN